MMTFPKTEASRLNSSLPTLQPMDFVKGILLLMRDSNMMAFFMTLQHFDQQKYKGLHPISPEDPNSTTLIHGEVPGFICSDGLQVVAHEILGQSIGL
ncbi:unnamed protein product [Lathyrus sativus]|nr:unnamed protein product [Lathyrus sativus]